MKFCYLDESGAGHEPILVMAGIVVDASRMHVTKELWRDFLARLSTVAGRTISEFHSREFYNGNGPWRGIDGATRARIITFIIDWIAARKHKTTFSAIDKRTYNDLIKKDTRLKELRTIWCASATHVTLSLQKEHGKQEKTKGHTVLIFDNEDREEGHLTECLLNPPSWTDSFYSKKNKQEQLDLIVDVPYFVDSRWVVLIQVADLIAYILRVHAEIEEGYSKERYSGEGARMNTWVEHIIAASLPRATRYPLKSRDEAAELFWKIAPQSLRR